MSRQVFISHSSKDKAVADAVCAALERRGLSCWIAPRDIVSGESWAKSIMRGIQSVEVMVVVVSTDSNQSQPVLNEVERAVHHKLPIIPFRIHPVTLSPELEFFLSTRHWLDANGAPPESFLDKLVDQVDFLLRSRSGHGASLAGPAPVGDGSSASPVDSSAVKTTTPADVPAANAEVPWKLPLFPRILLMGVTISVFVPSSLITLGHLIVVSRGQYNLASSLGGLLGYGLPALLSATLTRRLWRGRK
jgi:hypothetical protein